MKIGFFRKKRIYFLITPISFILIALTIVGVKKGAFTHALESNFTPEKFTATFDLNHGLSNDTPTKLSCFTTVESQGSCTIKQLASENQPTRNYLDFDGWLMSDSTKIKKDEDIVISENVTLTASWSFNKGAGPVYQTLSYFTMYYDSDGKKILDIDSTQLKDQCNAVMNTLELTCAINLPTAPEKPGYTFKGWLSSDGERYDAGEQITLHDSVFFYATWKSDNNNAIIRHSYSLNHGRAKSGWPIPTELSCFIEPGEESCEIIDPEEGPERPGFKFIGWAEENDNMHIGGVYVEDDSNVYHTGYLASWRQDVIGVSHTYSINYYDEDNTKYENMGSTTCTVVYGSAESPNVEELELIDTVRKECAVQIAESNPPEKDGFEFKGWMDYRGGGEEGEAIYQSNGSVVLHSDMNLYAVWTPKQETDQSESPRCATTNDPNIYIKDTSRTSEVKIYYKEKIECTNNYKTPYLEQDRTDNLPYSFDESTNTLTINNLGSKNDIHTIKINELSLNIVLQGENYFNLKLSHSNVAMRDVGVMNGNIIADVISNITINGARINAEKVYVDDKIVLNQGEMRVGKDGIHANSIEVNGGILNIDADDIGITIDSYAATDGSNGLTVNDGSVSIMAKNYAIIHEPYFDDIEGGLGRGLTAEEKSAQEFEDLVKLGNGVGVKEERITLQRYKELNNGMLRKQNDSYSIKASLAYGKFEPTKNGSAIRYAVRVLHIGKNYTNKISKNDKIETFESKDNLTLSFGLNELEIKKILLDDETLDSSKYVVKTVEYGYGHEFDFGYADGYGYKYKYVTILPEVFFGLKVGEHTLKLEFDDATRNLEHNFEITEEFKKNDYLLTAKDNPILEGTNKEFDFNKKEENYIIRYDRDVQLFNMITIDDKDVPEESYTVKSGSTIIEIDADYLKNLSNGEHTLNAYFLAEDEPISTRFTFKAKAADNSGEGVSEKEKQKSPNTPPTGIFTGEDDPASVMVIALIALPLALTVGYVAKNIKKRSSQRVRF